MDESAAVVISALLPHPPIIVPSVGGGRGAECRSTTDACRRLARRIVEAEPDRLFLVSPHAPREHLAYGIWSGERLTGDLRAFGCPEVAVDLPNDVALGRHLEAGGRERGIELRALSHRSLDHGSVVPLWFLAEAGWAGPTCIASLPVVGDARRHATLGRALGTAAAALGGRSALLASGDMSHRVLPGAPAGHHPRALEFDELVCSEVEGRRLERIADIDPGLRGLAAEDVVDSSALVIAATPSPARGTELLSYEHPFGVGYLVAVFHDAKATE